jgi:alcohol dehydrogenase (NADP+)
VGVQKSPLVPFSYQPRPLGPDDVEVAVSYCGICYSDIHQIDEGWGKGIFPMVPGHEIIGHVAAMGPNVKRFRIGSWLRQPVAPVA